MDEDGYTNVRTESYDLLVESIRKHKHLDKPAKTTLTLLLDTDQEIGKDTGTPEARVGISPLQAGQLIKTFSEFGITLKLFVVQGAGNLAGFPDSTYEKAGCELVNQNDLHSLSALPDVVHALKEPALHEGNIPGPFIRIGALHLVNLLNDPHFGMTALLKKRNFSAVLDGSTTGDCAYLKYKGYKNPIVASMSIFAGKIAAEKIGELYSGELLKEKRKAVVIGGGVAGLTAAEHLAEYCGEVSVLEINEQRVDELRHRFATVSSGTRFVVEKYNTANLERTLSNAVGLVLAHRYLAGQATKIVSLAQIETMAHGAVVVDISIDQGGSIENPDVQGDDLAEHIRKNTVALEQRGKVYFAEQNMPRAYPQDASIAHGKAVLANLAGLLALCAIHNGSQNATNFLLDIPERRFNNWDDLPQNYKDDYFLMLVQDLRNGIELAMKDGSLEITNAEIADNIPLAKKVRDYWNIGQ